MLPGRSSYRVDLNAFSGVSKITQHVANVDHTGVGTALTMRSAIASVQEVARA